MKINTRSVTLAATLAALCFVTGLLPYVFFLPVTVAAATVSAGVVAFVGLAFGAVSIIYSFVMPASFVAAAFVQAPYIAILPRIAAALGAFGVYKLLQKLFSPQKRVGRFACIAGSAATGSLLNTALVVGLMILALPGYAAEGVTLYVAVPSMLISGAIECVCMAAITPPIVMTLEKTVLRKNRRTEACGRGSEARDKTTDGTAV